MPNPRTQILVSIFLFPAVAALALSSYNPSGLRTQLRNALALNVTLALSPPVDSWESSGVGVFSGSGYELSIEENSTSGPSELKVLLRRTDGSRFTVENFHVACEISHPELFAIWTYNHVPTQHVNYRALATETFLDLAAPNSGIPFALAATREGMNVLALGLASQNRVVNLQGQPLSEGGYQISMDTRLPERVEQFEEIVYADATSSGWFEATRQYADWVDTQRKYTPFPISPACSYPLYDLWYWAFDDTSMGLYWTTLNQAKQLGFRSYLFDAGWESHQGEIFKWLEGTLGDYEPPDDKLLSFPGFLSYVQERLRMNVILWMSPYAVGRASKYYNLTNRYHVLFDRRSSEYHGGVEESPMTLQLGNRFEENVNLCPNHPETQNYMRSLLERVSKNYRPNGYWLDFQETIPFLCESFHWHQGTFGEGFDASQEAIKQTVQEHISQPTVEMRFPAANLNNKSHANLWQSIDSPGDFDTMRLCSMMMRPFSRGVVMGTDEMYWSPDADEKTVSKFVGTTVMTGVPAIGADFQRAPRSHSEIVRAWLQFFNTYKADLVSGEFLPFGDFTCPNQKIESDRVAFVYLRNMDQEPVVNLTRSPEEIYVMNSTDRDGLSIALQGLAEDDYEVEVWDTFLEPVSHSLLRLGGSTIISETVPEGGMVRLTRNR